MTKLIIRFFLILTASVVLFKFNYLDNYDLIIEFLLIIGLVLNYRKNENTVEALSNYFYWPIMMFVIFLYTKISLFSFIDAFIILLGLKTFILFLSYFKYKKVAVVSSYLSKIWIFTFYLYLTEIMLNSTHGFKSLFYYIGIISSIETILIILKNREWKLNCISVW
ncbi:hypothetical protein [Flavobacterium sp. 245]|uniref:hypothetical protein n=1 Tax=Flavobacterium sp. 245 TaxID=2512115 RepID=UPI00105FAB48|nr:hypothetical protein [Flavobacterium sp. 245]TDO99193.1 hypothetical protein EV145_107100 [Flavobacterium sp. 245]